MDERFAVIADIHGNADALRAVLADIEAQGARPILNLGDIASGPLAPAEVMDIVMATPMRSLRGNHDRVLVEADPADMGATDAVTHAALTAEQLDWLGALPFSLEIGDIFACHATPRHDETYWMERVTPEGNIVQRALGEIAEEAEGLATSLYLCGHSHLSRAVRLPDGALLVNPGSVGCPAYDDIAPVQHKVEAGCPHARYAIVSRTTRGWEATHRALPYDTTRMAAAARALGREDWAQAVSTGWL